MSKAAPDDIVAFQEGLSNAVLDQVPTPVMAVDKDLRIKFLNLAGRQFLRMKWKDIEGKHCYDLMKSIHCQTPECRMRRAMESGQAHTARNEVAPHGRVVPIEYSATPLFDDDGNVVGGVEYVLDITERVRNEKKLLEQSRTIEEISTPAIRLWDGIVVLPVVGVVDSMRAKQMMDAMLGKITETSAKIIILDIQGVAAMDTAVANHLIKITKATRLMGCRCIISGISAAVAQTLVQLGIDLGEVSTNSTLKDALSDGLSQLRLEVRRIKE